MTVLSDKIKVFMMVEQISKEEIRLGRELTEYEKQCLSRGFNMGWKGCSRKNYYYHMIKGEL